MRWVTAEDLKDWANRNDAKQLLPHLVRRLIEVTSSAVRSLEFPVAEGTQRHGFDGVADVRSDQEFVPDGVSVWEVSADNNVPAKAVDDFNERSEGPLPETLPGGIGRSEASYIGVTARSWPKRRKTGKAIASAGKSKKKSTKPKGLIDVTAVGNLEDFVLKMKSLGIWRGARMVDAYALERWLEQRPSVGAWAARCIGKHHGLVRDFEGEWEFLRLQSDPVPWSARMLLAGRAIEGKEVLEKLLEPGSVTSILADSVDEGVAFTIATVHGLPPEHSDRHRIFASALVVRDATEAEDLSRCKPLILILRDEAAKSARLLASKGHTCVAAIGRSTLKSGGAVIRLRRSPRDAFVQALQEDGFTWDQANQYARNCSASPTVLRRRIGGADNPHWADPHTLKELAPLALIGMFDLDAEGDRECLAELTGQSADNYVEVLQKHLGQGIDPPILMVQSQWSVYAPADILTVAFEHRIIGRPLLERFATVALKVLSEKDQSLSLSPDDRPFAGMRGIKRRYSSALRNGISESLRLLAANPEALRVELGGSGQTWIQDVVARCPGISDDPYALLSMGSMLLAVAEAAPSTFLDALEALLQGQRDAVQGILFAESDNALSPGSLFVNFTNALELIAWNPDKVSRVLDLLLSLSEMDPGGRISNRPITSLTEYFLPWAPATNTSVDWRAQHLDRIIKRASNRVAWNLIARLLPGATSSATSYSTPLWRTFDIGRDITYADVFAASTEVVRRAIVLAQGDIERWRALVAALTSSREADRAVILTALEHIDIRNTQREAFWDLLRQEVARNQRFADTNWALRDVDLSRLRAITQRFAPDNLDDRHSWLFDDGWPDVELEVEDGDDDEKARLRLRIAAIKEIFDAGGEAAILNFASRVKLPGMLVEALATLLPPDEVMRIALDAVRTFDDAYFASCLSAAGQAKFGPKWGADLLAAASALLPARQAALFILWRDSVETLDTVHAMGPDVEGAYWSMRNGWASTQEAAVQQRIVRGLLGAKRGLDVAAFVSAHRATLPTEVLLETVQSAHDKLAADPDVTNIGNMAFHLAEIIRTLAAREDAPEDEVVKLEFLFLNQIAGHSRTTGKLAIHRAMAKAPSFFIDIVKTVFRSDEEPRPTPEVTEETRAYAMQCYRLLGSFSLGKESSGEELLLRPQGALREWVKEVQKLAAESGRRVITDLQLGKLFATSSEDPDDGLRPHRAVREVIEASPTEEVTRGFATEVFNLRGVHSKSIDEGGAQEHQLASYWNTIADGLVQWPQTAAVARNVSAMWLAHAMDEDGRRDKRRARGE